MAPEIIEGKDAGPKSDLFSLGTLLYWLLTGKLPFDAPNTPALLRKVVDVQYDDPRLVNGAISDSLAAVVRSLLAREPAARPESAEAVRVALAAALAEDGISDPEASLRAFLADPPGFRHRFRAQLLTRLRGEADHALREGRTATALKLADRVLALEPTDPDAQRLVAAVSAQRRRRRRAIRALYACAGVAAIAGAVTGLRAVVSNRPRPAPAPVAIAPPAPVATPPVEAAAPKPDPTPVETPPSSEAAVSTPHSFPRPVREMPGRRAFSAAEQFRLTPRAPPPAEPAKVHFVVNPFATITVDGQPRTPQALHVADLMIAPGEHRVTYSAGDAYLPLSENVEIRGPQTDIRRVLTPKPAKLMVISKPADANVIVDGEPRGTAKDSAVQPILLKLDTPKQQMVVTVFKAGYADWSQSVSLRANEETVLRPELQRKGGP